MLSCFTQNPNPFAFETCTNLPTCPSIVCIVRYLRGNKICTLTNVSINMTTKEIVDDNTTASSDGEAGGDLPVAVAVEILPDTDEDEEAQAVALAAREEATASIREHCESHLSLNPTSSYVSWIATREYIL